MEGNMIEHHQNKYMNLMWMNRQQQVLTMPPFVKGRAAFSGNEYESWEERAFAEDAARGLGGFIWPPRSYTCSFCRREFKSAQALGGHMNVHRRDRARLKQALSPHSSETVHLDQQQHADSVPQQLTNEVLPANDEVRDHTKKERTIHILETERDNKVHVSTKLSMGTSLDDVVGAKNKCKRLKSGSLTLVDPCTLVIQSSTHHEARHLGGLKMRLMEELDLELRLGV